MTLAILQPVFIPDLYDLAMMQSADRIVLQDCEPWSRKGRTHRALVRTPAGTQYLNIPVKTDDRSKPICEVRIDHTEDWISSILKTLKYNYSNSVYYDFYEPEIHSDFREADHFDYLLPFTLHLRERLFRYLEIELKADILFGSTMESYDSDPDLLAEKLGADAYFQEHDARHYQRQGDKRNQCPFNHPVYRQHFDGFEPNCCLLDLLFQYGPESFKIIEGKKGTSAGI